MKSSLITIVTLLASFQASKPKANPNPRAMYGRKDVYSGRAFVKNQEKILPVPRPNRQEHQDLLPWQSPTRTVTTSVGTVTISSNVFTEVTEVVTTLGTNLIEFTETFVVDEHLVTWETQSIFETSTEIVQVDNVNTELFTNTDTDFSSSTETVNEAFYVTSTDLTVLLNTVTNNAFEGALEVVNTEVTETQSYEVPITVSPTDYATGLQTEVVTVTPDIVTVTVTEPTQVFVTIWETVNPVKQEIIEAIEDIVEAAEAAEEQDKQEEILAEVVPTVVDAAEKVVVEEHKPDEVSVEAAQPDFEAVAEVVV